MIRTAKPIRNAVLSVAPEVAEALAGGRPVVALESTIIVHGLPRPRNLDVARRLEKAVREEGGVPATIAILDGRIRVGLDDGDLQHLAEAEGIAKVSRRDLISKTGDTWKSLGSISELQAFFSVVDELNERVQLSLKVLTDEGDGAATVADASADASLTFAQLLQPNGFLDSQAARISVPDSLGGTRVAGIATALLRSRPVQDRLLKQVNRAAEKGAELAAPIVADTIRNMSISDALAIINGGPRAATALLQGQLGDTLVDRMLPGIGQGLRLFDNEIINLVLSQATNVDFNGIRRDVTNEVNDAIFRSIGAQEEAIRANPRATNDPLLIAVLGARKAY